MLLVPKSVTLVLLTLALITYIVYVILIARTLNKIIASKDLLRIVGNLTELITGGENMNKDNENVSACTPADDIHRLNIGGKTYKVEDNNLTLAELVKQNDSDKDYKDYIDVVTALLAERYKNFRFLRVSPTHGDYQSGYFLSFTVTRDQVPVEYEYLFRSAVSKGLSDSKINELFFEAVKSGNVLPLGDVEIVAGTGISSVTQADDLMVNIVFMPRDYYEKHLAEVEKSGAE